jgi:hypothetical protein
MDSFVKFYADMGARPSPEHTVDRKNSDGNYEKKNCRWATRKEQARNKRNSVMIVVGGRRISLLESAEEMGVNPETLRTRKRLGWADQAVVSVPVSRGQVVERDPSWRKEPRIRAPKRKTDGTKFAAQKRRWAEHVAAGLCVVCSKSTTKTIRCEKHRLEHNRKNRR